MLNENVFEITNLQINDNELMNNYNNNMLINTDENIIKYDEIIKELKYENEQLKSNIENIQKNYEMQLLENKNQIEDYQRKYNYSNKLGKELQNKIDLLENENNNYKKEVLEMNEKISNFDLLKDKNLGIENELKYNKAIIKYLESLLKRTGINPKLYTEETYRDEINKETNINNQNYNSNIKNNINNNNNNINNNINYYLEKNNSNESYEFNHKNHYKNSDLSIENNNLYNKKNNFENKIIDDEELEDEDYQENRPRQIKKEIDNLDEEIFELQSKLKKMLNKK